LRLFELRPAGPDDVQGNKLDILVTTHLADRLLKPERLTYRDAGLAGQAAGGKGGRRG
jgi:hypothetical protein